MAFYQNALATVKEARELLAKHKVPYKRPEDFFCDMLKSDEHMARVRMPVHLKHLRLSHMHAPDSCLRSG